jgi:hypothetical protein
VIGRVEQPAMTDIAIFLFAGVVALTFVLLIWDLGFRTNKQRRRAPSRTG